MNQEIFIKKISRRVKTLLIPYLVWSILGIILYLILQAIPFSSKYFSNEPITHLTIIQWLEVIFVKPIPYQLWFVRDLMIIQLFVPLIYFIPNKIKYVFLLILFVFWTTNTNFLAISSEGAFFFAIGGYISLEKKYLITKFYHSSLIALLGAFWFGICVLSVALKFNSFESDLIFIILHKTKIILGIFVIWTVFDLHFFKNIFFNRFLQLGQFSFFLYAFHEPYLTILKKGGNSVLGTTDSISLTLFLIFPILIACISHYLAKNLRFHLPPVYRILTGDR